MPRSIESARAALRLVKNRIWRTEVFALYSAPASPTRAEERNLTFTGINGLHREFDAACEVILSKPYSDFAESGDSGLLALSEGSLAGWLWVRPGPFIEAVGCGIAAIPPGVAVLRHVEVEEEFRGCGCATALLHEASSRLAGRSPQRVVAFIGERNAASLRAFDAAGFTNEGRVTFRRILTKPMKVRISEDGPAQ